MKCSDVCQRLSEYFDGEVPRAMKTAIAEHLAECQSCADELAAFGRLQQLVQSPVTLPSHPTWQQYNEWTANPKPAAHRPRLIRGWLATAAVLALVLLSALPLAISRLRGRGEHSTVSIDYREVLNVPSPEPSQIYQSLVQRFGNRTGGEGPEATSDASLPSYTPNTWRTLPNGIRLISNELLTLPQCKCAGGQCRCGPQGCNCAASLCRRPNGSDLLIVEHCATQEVTFGPLKWQHANRDRVPIDMAATQGLLIATWISDHRRLTAIGVDNLDEAQTMSSHWSSKPRSLNHSP